jgi:nucleoside 2-deoxyribosyltransferase
MFTTISIRQDVFVGGPIQHALTNDGFDGSLRSLFISLHDALELAGYGVLSAHRAEEFGRTTADLTSDEIAVRDHGWMQQCAAFVAVIPANLQGIPYRTDGTHVELGWASGQRKPIVLVATHPLAKGYSQLVQGLRRLTSVDVLDTREVREDPASVVLALNRVIGAPSQGVGQVAL